MYVKLRVKARYNMQSFALSHVGFRLSFFQYILCQFSRVLLYALKCDVSFTSIRPYVIMINIIINIAIYNININYECYNYFGNHRQCQMVQI